LYQDIAVYRVGPGNTFDFGSWTGKGGTTYTLTAAGGVVTSTQPGGSVY
jgi:hypothetical protein